MKYLACALLLLIGASSSTAHAGNPPALVPGTYGVPHTGPAVALPTLTLRQDFTFLYANPSGAEHPQDLTGTWALVGHKLVLTSPTTTKPMTWRIDSNGQSLSTRQGFCFTRLSQLSR